MGDARRGLRRRALMVLAGATAFGTARAAPIELTVSAASSVSTALREITTAYEAIQPGTRILVNAAASDALLAQIARGAPADVFISADQLVMDRAAAQRLLQAETRRDVIGNSMVLITPADSTLALRSAADLRSPAVTRIAIGQPSGVPAGRYAIGALEAAGLWPALAPKAIYAQNVRQALDYVARGEVDAGFVYASDAQLLGQRVRVAFTLATMVPVRYPAAVIASSRQPEAARRFVEHLVQLPAQAVFARHGFTRL